MKPSEPGAGALRLPEDSRDEAGARSAGTKVRVCGLPGSQRGGHFVVEASRLDSRRQTIRDRVVRHG